MRAWGVKSGRLTARRHPIRRVWSDAEVDGIAGVVVKCVEIGRNTQGETSRLGIYDAVRERGERTGLDTRVVHAVNDGHSAFGGGFSVSGGLS